MSYSPLRLALSSSQLNWGGGEQFLWSLGEGLQEQGHEVHWFAPKQSHLAEKLHRQGVICNEFPGRRFSLESLLSFRSRCRELKIQVFHANDPHALNWGALGLFGMNQVGRVVVKHTAFTVKRPYKYNLLAHQVVCVSHAVYNQCSYDGVWPSKMRVIYPGIKQETYDLETARRNIREELGVTLDCPVFVAVGNLYSCKAYEKLVLAAAELRERLPNFKVVICGEGPEREALEQLIAKHELSSNVHLLGFRSDATTWIAGSDALVHPSISEGLSLVAIQSQLLGIPVVAAKCGGLAEVLTDSNTGEDLGWIIESKDPKNLTDLMVDVLIDSPLKSRRLLLAKEHALKNFTISQMCEAFERLYLRVASKPTSVFRKITAPSPA